MAIKIQITKISDFISIVFTNIKAHISNFILINIIYKIRREKNLNLIQKRRNRKLFSERISKEQKGNCKDTRHLWYQLSDPVHLTSSASLSYGNERKQRRRAEATSSIPFIFLKEILAGRNQ